MQNRSNGESNERKTTTTSSECQQSSIMPRRMLARATPHRRRGRHPWDHFRRLVGQEDCPRDASLLCLRLEDSHHLEASRPTFHTRRHHRRAGPVVVLPTIATAIRNTPRKARGHGQEGPPPHRDECLLHMVWPESRMVVCPGQSAGTFRLPKICKGH